MPSFFEDPGTVHPPVGSAVTATAGSEARPASIEVSGTADVIALFPTMNLARSPVQPSLREACPDSHHVSAHRFARPL
jgi:hypothetical protein